MATIGKLAPRSYEEFHPSFEWIEEEWSDILRVTLPEFNKDNIKVQMDTAGNLRVSGERPLGAGNRWRRFRQDFRVPENCDAREIHAKLEDNVLDIVLPRLVAAKPRQQPPHQPTSPPQEPAAPSPRGEATKPRVGDDQDHNMIRSRKESTPTSNIMGATPPRVKPIADAAIAAAAAAAQAKEKTGEPAGQTMDGGLGKNLVVPEKGVESTNASAAAADAGRLGDLPRRRKESSAAAAGGVKDDGGAAGKPKLGASLSFSKSNQQLLLNVGVAVGVLVGLTSYFAYNLGKSIGTDCRRH